MAGYGIFAIAAVVLVAVVVFLAILTQRALEPRPAGGARMHDRTLTTDALYANVALSQLFVGGAFAALVWVTNVPLTHLGIGRGRFPIGWQLGVGVTVGVGLYLLNEGGVVLLDRLGIAYAEGLRRALRPRSGRGWVVLLLGVLPVIAIVEELVFRGVLIGALGAGGPVPTAALVVISSVVFAMGHGLQGGGGVLVTGTLGLLLGVIFVASGSLLVVVIAHYLVNALEFIVHEGWLASE